MLINPTNYLCNGIFLLSLFFMLAEYAYLVNAKRPPGDPKKRNYQFGAILLAPITWPLFLIAPLILFLLRIFVWIILNLLQLGLWILFKSSQIFLSFVILILQLALKLLKGHFLLRFGLVLFIMGSAFQFLAHLI